MNKLVTSSLTDDEITEIVTEAENIFGVYPGDVEVEVTYDIMGAISVETDGSEITEEEAPEYHLEMESEFIEN